MNELIGLTASTDTVAAYYAGLTDLLRQSEASGAPDFDRGWHAGIIATAAAYLTFQHAGEYYSLLEANAIRHRLHEIIEDVFELLGHKHAHAEWLRREFGSDPDSLPDPA